MNFFDIFKINKLKEQLYTLQQNNAALTEQLNSLQQNNAALAEQLNSLGANDYFTVQKNIKQLQADYDQKFQIPS